jgi:hypothetical protein
MERLIVLRRYLFVPVIIGVAACSTEPNPQDIPGTYTATFDPPQLASATVNCDRLIPHAVLTMAQAGQFDLTINLVDDCSRAGGGSTASELHLVGFYAPQGAQLYFTPETSTAPPFTGTVEGSFVRLNLPPAVGIAIVDVHIRVGPRLR